MYSPLWNSFYHSVIYCFLSIKHFPLPVGVGACPVRLTSGPCPPMKTVTEASGGRLRSHPQEGRAVPVLALEVEMTSPNLRGTSTGWVDQARGNEAGWKCGLMSAVRGPRPEQTGARSHRAEPRAASLCSIEGCLPSLVPTGAGSRPVAERFAQVPLPPLSGPQPPAVLSSGSDPARGSQPVGHGLRTAPGEPKTLGNHRSLHNDSLTSKISYWK